MKVCGRCRTRLLRKAKFCSRCGERYVRPTVRAFRSTKRFFGIQIPSIYSKACELFAEAVIRRQRLAQERAERQVQARIKSDQAIEKGKAHQAALAAERKAEEEAKKNPPAVVYYPEVVAREHAGDVNFRRGMYYGIYYKNRYYKDSYSDLETAYRVKARLDSQDYLERWRSISAMDFSNTTIRS